MNTDVRRAVFLAVMGSGDCNEAHERLLRLPLKGDQQREVVRVLVECCLAEKAWNPYYALLALRLCGAGGGGGGDGGKKGSGSGGGGGGSVGRAHRVTLQFCLWDHFKEAEAMDVRQLSHLGRLAATAVARFALSLSLLKAVDLGGRLSAKQAFLWRVFLQHLLATCRTAGDVKEIFGRVAGQPKALGPLITGLLLFLRGSFAPWLAAKDGDGPLAAGGASGAVGVDELLRRVRVAEKALAAGATAAAVGM